MAFIREEPVHPEDVKYPVLAIDPLSTARKYASAAELVRAGDFCTATKYEDMLIVDSLGAVYGVIEARIDEEDAKVLLIFNRKRRIARITLKRYELNHAQVKVLVLMALRHEAVSHETPDGAAKLLATQQAVAKSSNLTELVESIDCWAYSAPP